MKTFLYISAIFAILARGYAQQAAVTLPYTQDFEGATFLPADWEAFGSNTNTAWQHSTTVGAYGLSTSSAFFDNFSANWSGNYYGMRAAAIDLTTAVKPTMHFDVAYARKDAANSDRLGIWYSFNGTTGWTNLATYQDANLVTAPDQTAYFNPAASQWQTISIDLTQFAGKPLLRMAFENNPDFGNVMYIDNVKFFDDHFTGLKELSSNRINLYPNPVTGKKITIEMTTGKLKKLSIINQLGQLVSRQITIPSGSKKYLLNLSDLPSGVYQLSITCEDGSRESKKIIIQ